MNEDPPSGTPITVTLRTLSTGPEMYGLRSGLQTLKASIALSQTEMPALVIEGAPRRLFPYARLEASAARCIVGAGTAELASVIEGTRTGGNPMTESAPNVEMIPIEQIHILNPRTRNKATFQDVTSNISNVGLKKPITVARRERSPEGKPYDLACGQGRLEAYIALGQTEIPAIVIEATREECYLMSLIENLARRPHAPLELMREINSLKSRGYNTTDIAKKIDLAKSYVIGIAHLLNHGEERLLAAVDKGKIPLSVAMQISNSDDTGIQQALCNAYENKTLRGRKLQTVRKIIEQRKTKGKKFNPGHKSKEERVPTADGLVRVYRQEADRQKDIVRKARLTENRLLFIVTALKKLFHDENFLTLLKAEQLDTLPTYLAEKIPIPAASAVV